MIRLSLELKRTIEVIKEQKMAYMKTKVDIGCNIFVQADMYNSKNESRSPDTSTMIIRVRPNLYVEMTLEEATKFLSQQETLLNKKVDIHTQNVNRIKAHIAFVSFAVL